MNSTHNLNFQVRVWIGDHYYTFSRFLVSRVLAVTKVRSSQIFS